MLHRAYQLHKHNQIVHVIAMSAPGMHTHNVH